ncbi:MAG: SH3 domain-containing protein [Parachlamydiales bacterium]|nr:SH3 domain-containing protein [Parachlamydiales bacterium]
MRLTSLFCLLSLTTVNSLAFAEEAQTKTAAQEAGQVASAAIVKPAFEAFTGKVKRKSVRLRLRPDLDSPVIRDLQAGDLLVVDGEQNHFYAVQPPKGVKGYVFRSFVLDGVVEGSRVNIRLEPSLDAPIVGQLNSGDKIKANICTAQPKWLEIDLPSTVRLFVASDFVSNAGKPELFAQLETRRSEVEQAVNQACLLSQSEMRKSFEEIDIQKARDQFQKIAKDFSDFPEEVKKSQELAAMLNEAYIQKKIAYLEDKTQHAQEAFTAKQAVFDHEVYAYQEKLGEIDRQLQHSQSFAEGAQLATEDANCNALDADKSPYVVMTDQMRVWEPVEKSLYLSWVKEHDGEDIDAFYSEQELESKVLTGILEPFTRHVMNRPGDFILKQGQAPVAYLYSTKINLQDKIGQQVKVIAVQRDSNNFAYPAFYVISVE